jgi:hypothetical protein
MKVTSLELDFILTCLKNDNKSEERRIESSIELDKKKHSKSRKKGEFGESLLI